MFYPSRGIGCALLVMYLIEAAWSVAVVAFLLWVVRDPDAAANFALLVFDKALRFGSAVVRGVGQQIGQLDSAKELF